MRRYVWIFLLLLCASCGGGSSSTSTGGTGNNGNGSDSGAAAGIINGMVTDSGTGGRLSGVTVTSGSTTTTTDDNGQFTLSGLADGKVQIAFTKSGYASGYSVADAGNTPEPVLVSMKQQGSLQDYNTAQTATLYQTTENGPYAVTFTPNSLDTTDANLHVAVTPLDPTSEISALPGNLVTSDAVLLPLTFAEFAIYDSAGNRVNLKSGAQATVELPIPASLRSLPQYQISSDPNNPTVIHCYSYDTTTGEWDDFVVGIVTLSSVDNTTPVVKATVKHFSWYGAAPEGQNCVPVSGKVVSAKDNTALVNVLVKGTPGTNSYTDSSGNFTVWVPTGNGDVTVTAARTYTDTDGSISGTKGAVVIDSGKASNISLSGLTSIPCTQVSAMSGSGGQSGSVTIKLGYIGQASYMVTAYLIPDSTAAKSLKLLGLSGHPVPMALIRRLESIAARRSTQARTRASTTTSAEVYAVLETILPDGSEGDPVDTASITLSGPDGSSSTLTPLGYSSGVYDLTTNVVPGERYTLSVDADNNGSVDGSGSVYVVGNLAWVNPTDGATVSANGLTARWSDSAVGVDSAYSVLYEAVIAGSDDATTDASFYLGSDLSYDPYHYDFENLGNQQPLMAGSYSGDLWAFSGPFLAPTPDGINFDLTNNITGLTVNGQFYSWGDADTSINFTLTN